jgi:PPM family protein phosphatase
VARTLRWGAQSITGNYRENNEDRCFVDPQGRFCIVADGMGGQSAGERASQYAVEIVSKKVAQFVDFSSGDQAQSSKYIDAAIQEANGEILANSELDPDLRNMGTTIAVVVRSGDAVSVAGVGDSRVYLLRKGDLQQLTTDHSIAQALVDAGTISPEEVSTHRYKNMLYKYLGSKEGFGATETRWIPLQAGDRILACSDGVSDGLKREQLTPLLAKFADPKQAAEGIVAAALEGGSRDNITCVVAFVE